MVDSGVLVVGSGVGIGVLGALIKYAGMRHLIAGYDPDRVSDAAGLSDFVGTNTLVVAALTVAVGVLELASAPGTDWYWLVFVVAVVTLAIRMVRGARRY